MTLNLLVDNDVLIKCACYAMLDQIQTPDTSDTETGDAGTETGILGTALFVVRDRLKRGEKISDRAAAQQHFELYLQTVAILEPTDEELRLASSIEDIGARLSLDLDYGESQLCAIAVARLTPFLLTGDKRAIVGAESLKEELPVLSALCGRIICLEQALIDIVTRIGMPVARFKVCAEPSVDKSLTICFECSSGNSRTDFNIDGLESYVRSLRGQAPTLLYDPSTT